MTTIQTRTVTRTRILCGTLTGRAWGGFEAHQSFTLELQRGETLAAAMARALAKHGGDFETCAIDPEQSEVSFRRATVRRGARSLAIADRIRVIQLCEFKAAAGPAGAADFV